MASLHPRSGGRGAIDQLKAELGPMGDLLSRHGYDPRPHRLLCPNPSHDDHRPGSVSIYLAVDGDERLRCWSCQLDEDLVGVAEVLGERVELGRGDFPGREKARPKPPSFEDLLRLLSKRAAKGTLTFELTAAMELARIHRDAAMVEIARNGDWLAEHGDLKLIIDLADRLRTYLPERFGVPAGFAWTQDEVRQAIEELGS